MGFMDGKRFFPLIFFLSCIVLTGCDRINLISTWRNHEIVINGKYTDFGNVMAYYDEKERVAINLFNDNDYLYICLISRNRQIETQLMMSGFVVWFDPDGGKNKVFGIHFPLGMKEMGMPMAEGERYSEDERGRESGMARERGRHKDFEKRLEILEGLQEKIELIIGPVNAKGKGMPIELSLEDANKQGIEAKMGHQNEYFVYELKVPFIKSVQHQYAIGAKTGKPIGFGLEITVSDMEMANADMGRHKSRGEGRMPSGMGHRMYPGEGFQLWATVTLSSGSF